MPNASLIATWTRNGSAYASARVAEGPPLGNVEYTASVPLDADWQAANLAGKKSLLVAALKAVRDAQLNAPVDLGVTGTVVL